ncbi:hypothetical protein D3C87_1211000 [compost metagenome]
MTIPVSLRIWRVTILGNYHGHYVSTARGAGYADTVVELSSSDSGQEGPLSPRISCIEIIIIHAYCCIHI